MPSGRYQSQFFNFLNRSTQKLADRTATLLRHAKVTAIWGTQIVLYPVYALFQTARLVGRQLGQTVQRSLIRLQLREFNSDQSSQDPANLLTSDIPIQKVLTSVKHALLSGGDLPDSEPRSALVWIGRIFLPFKSRASELAPSNPYNIQGIASLVDTHRLVLILEGNVIFDTLSDEQQRQIEQRIIFELARYWRWRRKLYLKSAPLGLPEDRETLIPPVRVFRQLMIWIQSSPVAIATNLFQESAIVPQTSGEVEWFTPNVPLSAWNPANVVPKRLPSKKDLDKWAGQLPRWGDLEALVWAAIHYFFGSSRKLASAQGELPYSAESSPWLSASDVFGDSQQRLIQRDFKPIQGTVIAETLPPAHSTSDTLTLPTRSTFKFGRSVRNFIQSYLKAFSTAIVWQRPAPSTLEKSTLEKSTVSALDNSEATVEFSEPREIYLVTTQESTPTTVESSAAPVLETPYLKDAEDWIEIPASHIEYVRSPWEKFLAWLDSGMLWLEQHLILFWRWLTHRNP